MSLVYCGSACHDKRVRASLAAARQAKDAAKLDDKERTRLRKDALD
jgi:hypothetical protein